MKITFIATNKLCLAIICITGINNFLFAQDTLILKPTKKKPQGDTLIVKLAMVYYAKELSYFSYNNFELTKRDQKLLRMRKMIKRKGQKRIDAFSVEKILYDENQKNNILFVERNRHKVNRYQELQKIKNIVSIGVTYTSFSTIEKGIDFNFFGSSETKLIPVPYVFFLQPTYERLVYKGILGLRVSPIIGMNKPAIGVGMGNRIYLRKQKPFCFALGTDISFINSTVNRQLSRLSEHVWGENSYEKWKKENKNELLFSPIVLQFSYTLKNNYHLSLDLSYGIRHIFSNKPFTIDDKRYKYRGTPYTDQIRLNIGKKF